MALTNCNITLNNNGGDEDDLIHNKDGDSEIDNWEEEEEEEEENDDMSDNDLDTAIVAEKYNNIEVLFDIESDNEEYDNNSHISESTIVNELTDIEIMNDISPNCLLNYKENKMNDHLTLSANMIAAIE